MDKKKAIDFVQELLRSNEDKKPEDQLSRKEIVDILTVDHLIPESTAYRYYADAERIYIWEQEKSGNPVAVDCLYLNSVSCCSWTRVEIIL